MIKKIKMKNFFFFFVKTMVFLFIYSLITISLFLIFNGSLNFLSLLNKRYFGFFWFENFKNSYFENFFNIVLFIKFLLKDKIIPFLQSNDFCYSLFSQEKIFYFNFVLFLLFLVFLIKFIIIFFNSYFKAFLLNIIYLLVIMDIFDFIILYFDFLIFVFLLHTGLFMNWVLFQFFDFLRNNYDRKNKRNVKDDIFFWKTLKDQNGNWKVDNDFKTMLNSYNVDNLILEINNKDSFSKIISAHDELSKLLMSCFFCTIDNLDTKEIIINILFKKFEFLGYNIDEIRFLTLKKLNWRFYNLDNYNIVLSENNKISISAAFIFAEELNFEAFNFLKKKEDNIIILSLESLFYLLIFDVSFQNFIKIKKIYKIG